MPPDFFQARWYMLINGQRPKNQGWTFVCQSTSPLSTNLSSCRAFELRPAATGSIVGLLLRIINTTANTARGQGCGKLKSGPGLTKFYGCRGVATLRFEEGNALPSYTGWCGQSDDQVRIWCAACIEPTDTNLYSNASHANEPIFWTPPQTPQT